MKRKRYDDKFRASAVVMLEAAGYPANAFRLQEVADRLGVPGRTLRRWYNGEHNAPPDDVVTQVKKELSERLEELTHKLVDMAFTIAESAVDDTSIQQATTSIGIVVDKLQLLKGKATERIDHTGLTREERISRISTLIDGRGTRGTTGTPRSTDD